MIAAGGAAPLRAAIRQGFPAMMMWRGLSPKLLAALFDRRRHGGGEKPADDSSVRSDPIRGENAAQRPAARTPLPPRGVSTARR